MFPIIWEAGPVLGFAGMLAHQGGWDETLFVVAPVGLFIGLLWLANHRARPDGGADDANPPHDQPGDS